jgi:hypothetical protein
MIRRCEGKKMEDQDEKVIEWAKALDVVMVGTVEGWRAKARRRRWMPRQW